MKALLGLCFGLLLPGALAAAAPAAAPPARERLLLDFGWRFHLGNEWGSGQNLAKSGSSVGPANMSFSDAGWRAVDLPHDWAIELPFDQHADGGHGFKPVGTGFPKSSVGWYRRTFTLPASDAGKRLWLEFDGVFRDATVFVNGWFVGHHESGYSGFRYDITDVAEVGGRNVVAVRVDASEFEGWFYEGAGIYRHTWLVKTSPVAVAWTRYGAADSRTINAIVRGSSALAITAQVRSAQLPRYSCCADPRPASTTAPLIASSRVAGRGGGEAQAVNTMAPIASTAVVATWRIPFTGGAASGLRSAGMPRRR